MQCEAVQDLLGALRDGELDAVERRNVEAHLETCRACRDMLGDFTRIGAGLRAQGRAATPAALAARIHDALDRVEPESPRVIPFKPAAQRWRPSRALVAQAASLVVVAGLASAITASIIGARDEAALAERELVTAHVRSLVQDSPVQIASSDRHNVAPWFAGRVDFAPRVSDLATEGFPLVGGRVDVLGERRVGAIVYKRRLHVINVFMWPAQGSDETPKTAARNGYNVVSWRKKGVAWRAVSDLNTAEMLALQGLL